MNRHDLDLIEIGEKAGAEKERQAIAAWLRKFNYQQIADAIEAEEHLQ